MKNIVKFILVMFALASSFSANSQITMTTAGSPVTNTGTATSTLKVSGSTAYISIQTTFTKTSGTLAGTATLQGSIDGTSYKTIDTLSTVSNLATYTVTDTASQSVIFIVKNNAYNYYRISWTGSGTMVGTMSSVLVNK